MTGVELGLSMSGSLGGLSKTSRFGDSHGSRTFQKPGLSLKRKPGLSPKRLASNREFLTGQPCGVGASASEPPVKLFANPTSATT